VTQNVGLNPQREPSSPAPSAYNRSNFFWEKRKNYTYTITLQRETGSLGEKSHRVRKDSTKKKKARY